MREDEFNELMDARFAFCRNLMAPKSAEYSRGGDKLHNFRVAALFEKCTPEMALRGFLTKHIVSMYDMVDDIEFRGIVPSEETVDAKFSDIIVYLCLLEALIKARRNACEEIQNLRGKNV